LFPQDLRFVLFLACSSLTVGLIAVGVWSNYSSVSGIVSADAANIASMYRDVSGYPELIRTDLQGHRVHHRSSVAGSDAWGVYR